MKKPASVQEFLEQKVLPQYRPVVERLRELMKQYAPEAQETITYGILGWRFQRIVAVVSPTKKDITFAFSRGAEFTDRHGLLRGEGKVSKNVKLRTVADIDAAALRDYIRQAVALETEEAADARKSAVSRRSGGPRSRGRRA